MRATIDVEKQNNFPLCNTNLSTLKEAFSSDVGDFGLGMCGFD